MSYITRYEAAKLIGVDSDTIRRWEKNGKVPLTVFMLSTDYSTKKIVHYKRSEFINLGLSYDDKHTRVTSKHRQKKSRALIVKNEYDVWNIRGKNKPFVYSGAIKNHILFCRNMILNRGVTFDTKNPI